MSLLAFSLMERSLLQTVRLAHVILWLMTVQCLKRSEPQPVILYMMPTLDPDCAAL